MSRNFVVDFRLPFDPLFVHHGTNVLARNATDAVRIFIRSVPNAQRVSASEGCVCLYGRKWCDWDSSCGALCRPLGAPPLLHVDPLTVDCALDTEEFV